MAADPARAARVGAGARVGRPRDGRRRPARLHRAGATRDGATVGVWPSTSSTSSGRSRRASPSRSSRSSPPACPSAAGPAWTIRDRPGRARHHLRPGRRQDARHRGCGWLLARFTRATLDDELSWVDVVGMSMLAGIGFTVSLLIGELAFGAPPSRTTASRSAYSSAPSGRRLAAVVLRLRNRVYRRLCEVEQRDSDDDGVPDAFLRDHAATPPLVGRVDLRARQSPGPDDAEDPAPADEPTIGRLVTTPPDIRPWSRRRSSSRSPSSRSASRPAASASACSRRLPSSSCWP